MATDVLDGVKVVELAIHGFVPSCGAVLADWGADVVKIEAPAGDPLRHIMGAGLVADTGDFNFLWELFNRNKRGVAVDLRVEEGRAVFDRLLDDADVFLTNFLPTARPSSASTPKTSGRSTRASSTPRATGKVSVVKTQTSAGSTPSATGRAVASAMCSHHRKGR